MKYQPTGRREVAEQVIVALLCEAVVQVVIFAADYARRKHNLWRCPECGKSHERQVEQKGSEKDV